MIRSNEFEIKALSSLEKVFLDEDLSEKNEITSFAMYKNQKLCYQVAFLSKVPAHTVNRYPQAKISFTGTLAKYASVRQVQSVPSLYPVNKNNVDEDYLRHDVGLYPDVLSPIHYDGKITVASDQATSLWINVDLPKNFKAGEYDLTVNLDIEHSENSEHAEKTVKVKVLNANLPEQKTIHTEWFYTDCIANYHNVKAFSKEHFRLIGEYMKVAVQNGINMILTPVFTPELDTYVGGERLTTQLVKIEQNSGVYSFDFTLLGKWIDLANKCGVEYLEICHLFSQWGARKTPKIIVKVDGVETKKFGWHTDALGEEYLAFLDAFLPELVKYLKEKGVEKRCYFHVSDEPSTKNLEHYLACSKVLNKHLSEFHIIDALSKFDFYETGALKKPVPSISHIEDFLGKGIDGLWAYYCGAGGTSDGTSNRFLSMPLARVRIIGIQLYKYSIEGFLHWGYNFYNTMLSYNVVDPYLDTTGEFFGPSGDCYLVYPSNEGTPRESLRLNAMREAFEDIRALELLESYYGRDFVVKLIDSEAGMDLDFRHYPKGEEFILRLREKVAILTEKAVNK